MLRLLFFHWAFAAAISTAPTVSPTTKAPSNAPSRAPTAPTKFPTSAPSRAPQFPTNTPTTKAPTEVPTGPTKVPSEAPTTFPTSSPTHIPTNAPTFAPTSRPTSSSPTVYIPPCERNLTLTQIYDLIYSNVTKCPVVIQDYSGQKKVYEMANFLASALHPHGADDILQFCGRDMTQAFMDGPHASVPFPGEQGMVLGANRSSLFECIGTFVSSTLQPTAPTTLAPSEAASIYPCLSAGKEYQIRQAILNSYNSIPITANNTERAAFNGGLVRLAFHDAATYSRLSDDGESDGYVNLLDSENAGLAKHVIAMDLLWTPFKDRISRADFWFLAAVTAIENAGGPVITFRYGRKDCTTNCLKNNAVGRLPLANRDWTYVHGLFNYSMGMSDREITALMGAHVLGSTHPQNSGFDGTWVSGDSPGMLFSNQFYLGLETVDWVKAENNFTGYPGRMQWNQENVGPGRQMFLTSDVTLLLTNADSPNCTHSLVDTNVANLSNARPLDPDCVVNKATLPIVYEYSRNQASFYRDFAAVYQKISELGHPEGTLIPPGTCFPGALTFPNDPPVPLPPSPAADTIGGMSAVGFAVLLVVLVLVLVFAALAAQYWYRRRSRKSLNETEAELIRQTSAARANANSPSATNEPEVERRETVAVDPADVPTLPSSFPRDISAFAITPEPVS